MRDLGKIKQLHDLDINLDKIKEIYSKINFPLEIGRKVRWYYKDDLEFWKREKFLNKKTTPKDLAQNEGIIIPVNDVEIRGSEIDLDNCIVVIYDYSCEKCYPESYYISLGELVSNDDLVEIF